VRNASATSPPRLPSSYGPRQETSYQQLKPRDGSGERAGAIRVPDGRREWRLNGKLHREDGPAVEWADGRREWWLHGERHREDGPALEWADGGASARCYAFAAQLARIGGNAARRRAAAHPHAERHAGLPTPPPSPFRRPPHASGIADHPNSGERSPTPLIHDSLKRRPQRPRSARVAAANPDSQERSAKGTTTTHGSQAGSSRCCSRISRRISL
jgi:hypothetical protein